MDDGLLNAEEMLKQLEESFKLKLQDLEDQLDEMGQGGGGGGEDDSDRRNAMGARAQQQLLAAVKHIQHEFDRVDNKVDDMWKRMPKIIAFLEPPEPSEAEVRKWSKESRAASRESASDVSAPSPQNQSQSRRTSGASVQQQAPVSNKDQVNALTRMMQE